MTTKADYTDEEWRVLVRAPLVAGLAIALADPGGPIEETKESWAALKAARNPPSGEELLVAVSQDLNDRIRTQEKPMEDLEFRGRGAKKRVVQELATVNGILAAKAAPEEAASFRLWLVEVAGATADAAKEGGFLGIAATQVSKSEWAMLEEIRTILGIATD